MLINQLGEILSQCIYIYQIIMIYSLNILQFCRSRYTSKSPPPKSHRKPTANKQERSICFFILQIGSLPLPPPVKRS